MKIIFLIIRLAYFIFLGGILIFLILFPGSRFGETLLEVFFWLFVVGYLVLVIKKYLRSSTSFNCGLICFLLGALIFSAGLIQMGEIILKLGFTFFLIGLFQSFFSLKYKK